MDSSSILAVLGFAGLVSLFIASIALDGILSARRFAKLSARLEQQALERGWEYQGSRKDITTIHSFSGRASDVPWQIESYYCESRSRIKFSLERYTRWSTEAAALSGEVVLLVPFTGKTYQAFGPGIGVWGGVARLNSSMFQEILHNFVTSVLHAAPEDAGTFDNAQLVQAGSEELQQHYTIVATSQKTAGRLLDEAAERVLLDLAPKKQRDGQKLRAIAVVYWHKGIQLIIDEQITDIGRLEQLVQCGLALASGQKSSGWAS